MTEPRGPSPSAPEPTRGRGGRRFVLVTGMPRSGTTGIGSALAHAPGAAYLYEPLNAESGLRSVPEYFLLPDDPGVDERLAEVLGLHLRVRDGVWPTDGALRRTVKRVTGSRTRTSAYRCRFDPRVRTVVWKDPFAAFLVDRVVARHAMPTVVTVRSPEATAASFKRLGWSFDVDRVRRKVAARFPDLDAAVREDGWDAWADSPTTNGALLWRLLYGHLDAALTGLPGLTGPAAAPPPVAWVSTAGLIADPMAAYRRLYALAGLELTADARAAIEQDYRDEGTSEPSATRTHDPHRNVQQSTDYWTRTLDPAEVEAVRQITAAVRPRVEARTGPLD
ncbi:hypothetical protein QWY28_11220 [Nocardioides sp. SOB77]|uniref:Sulfotransferase family protein n=1 Tax=Nocardioides oceani TaxID=3058369 RepID=A0ABT8FH88_9ACTN|nr:hypothetical protein [Nocardioides oceani]MDN4173517.1 hypothetical protein [Nocardioides oceani]